MHKICNIQTGEWMPIPGRVYAVKLPIIEEFVPALRDHPLIAHRSIDGRGWTVTHKATSSAVAHGRTRAEAITRAYQVLALVGNDGFLRAIRKAEREIRKAEAQLEAKSAP